MSKLKTKRLKSTRASAAPSNGANVKWRSLFKLIPGYDAEATAGRGDKFDGELADSIISWISSELTHIEGLGVAGKPLNLEPWQQAIVGCAFGWKRSDGTRRYREVFQYVPRKNGKSTLLGALINLVAICDGEPGAQIYSAAADREQATLVYRQAKGMLMNNPDLAEGTRVYSTFKSIEYPKGVVYKALSAEADTKHGFNTHFVAVDELHAQPNRDLVDVLITSTGSRKQPLVWYITTADFDRDSICNEKLDYAEKIRDGIISDRAFLPVIYAASMEDDWTDPKVWERVNPNLGISVSREYIERECQRAKDTPTYENTFKRLHLNIKTQNDVRWLSIEKWDACNDAADAELLAGRDCYGGFDLSSKIDLTAWVLVFPPTDEDPKWRVLPRFWAPADNAEMRERRDRVPYLSWARLGHIELTPGNVVDYDYIKAAILEDSRRFQIKGIAYDQWNATQIALQLQAEGANVMEFGQGYRSMSEPTKELEKLVMEKMLAHGGNPVLRWMASNVSVESDPAGNLKPSKKKSTEKIDGIVATVMALGLAIADPQGPSIYDERGIEVF